MSFTFSMSFGDDDFDKIRDYYDPEATTRVKKKVKEDMRQHILDKVSEGDDE